MIISENLSENRDSAIDLGQTIKKSQRAFQSTHI